MEVSPQAPSSVQRRPRLIIDPLSRNLTAVVRSKENRISIPLLITDPVHGASAGEPTR